MILAGIDIGTNTLRLLIADVRGGVISGLVSERIVARLGQDLDRTGVLSRPAQDRALQALVGFTRRISDHACDAVSAVATSALRNARNTGEFLREARERTGLEIRVISGEEEALLTLAGVRGALRRERLGEDPLASSVVIDIGGGSTELIVSDQGRVRHLLSLHLGAVYLTDSLLAHDPPSEGEMLSLRSAVRRDLDVWERELERAAGLRPDGLRALAGTAGTITTLAAMDLKLAHYDPEPINGHVLSRPALDGLVDDLRSRTQEQRKGLPGLEPGREDIILAGAVICQEIMDRCGRQDLLVSGWGLREGIVLDLAARRIAR